MLDDVRKLIYRGGKKGKQRQRSSIKWGSEPSTHHHPAEMPLGPAGRAQTEGWLGSQQAYAGSRGELMVLGYSVFNSDPYAPRGEQCHAKPLNTGVRVTWRHQKGT